MRDEELHYQTDYTAGQREAAHRVLIEITNILDEYKDHILVIGWYQIVRVFDKMDAYKIM